MKMISDDDVTSNRYSVILINDIYEYIQKNNPTLNEILDHFHALNDLNGKRTIKKRIRTLIIQRYVYPKDGRFHGSTFEE